MTSRRFSSPTSPNVALTVLPISEGGLSRRSLLLGAGALGAAALGGGLAGCSSGGGDAGQGVAPAPSGSYAGPKVDISFWNGWTGGTAPQLVPKLVSQFNSEHPNITVKNNTVQWGDYFAKVPSATKAGQGPDVGVVHGDDVATFAAQQLIIPVDEIIASLGYQPGDFPPGLLDNTGYQGKKYAVPYSVTPIGLYYNEATLQRAGLDATKPPATGQEYRAVLAALKKDGVQGEWVDPFQFTGVFEWQSLLWQFGGAMFNDDVSKATFNSDAGVQALSWMTDLISGGYSPKNVGANTNYTAMRNGKTAFSWQGVWQTSDIAASKGLTVATAEVPMIGSQKAVWSSSTHWVFYNKPKQDQNKIQAAATFVRWFIDHSLDWAGVGELPAKNAVRNDPKLLSTYPLLKPFLAELEYAHYETVAPGIADVSQTFITAVNEAILGRKSPKQALDDAAALADKRLTDNKSQYGG